MFLAAIEKFKPSIESLPVRLRVAFLAGCAEYSLSSYEAWVDESGFPLANSEALHEAVSYLWRFAEGEMLEKTSLRSILNVVEAATPHTEDYGNASLAGGLDSPLCVAHAVDYLLNQDDLSYCLTVATNALLAADDVTYLSAYINSLSRDRQDEFFQLRLRDTFFPMAREYERQKQSLTLLKKWNVDTITRSDFEAEM